MLKKTLTTGLIATGACAQAQSQTIVTFEAVAATFKPAEAYSLSTQTLWRAGDFALQADFTLTTVTDAAVFSFPNSPTISGENVIMGLHAVYPITDHFRIGGFTTFSFIPDSFYAQASTLGAEAMISIGKLDIEVAAAFEFPFHYVDSYRSGHLFFAAYYEISPQIEVSLESSAWVSEVGPISRQIFTSANLSYSAPLAPITFKIGALRRFHIDFEPITSVQASVSYEFGAPTENRPFGRRGFDYLARTVSGRS